DVGVADPQALGVAVGALEAFRFVGIPEGFLPMTQAGVYLAPAPQSNTAPTPHAAAKEDVDGHRARPRPAHPPPPPPPRHTTRGWGAAYQYPHDFEGNYVRQEYLPEPLRGHRYYQPTDSGREREIKERLERLRSKP